MSHKIARDYLQFRFYCVFFLVTLIDSRKNRFEIDDVARGLAYRPESFDLIHIRMLVYGIQDWPTLYEDCAKCLRPGGLLVHLEPEPRPFNFDGSDHPAFTKYCEMIKSSVAKKVRIFLILLFLFFISFFDDEYGLNQQPWNVILQGCHVDIGSEAAGLLEANGSFEEICMTSLDFPVDKYPVDPALIEKSRMWMNDIALLLHAMKPVFMNGGYSEEWLEALYADCRAEWEGQ
jgi:SAM-dependent methyltransferase